MITIGGGPVKIFRVFLLTVGLIAVVSFGIVVGIHVFLAAVGHYAPWEQIWGRITSRSIVLLIRIY